MKRKYHSAIYVSWLVGGTIVAFLYPLLSSGAPAISHKLPTVKPLADIQVPAPDVLARIDVLDRAMPVLAGGPPARSKAVDLSLLGYLPMPAGRYSGRQGRESGFADYKVTMAFYSPKRRFCVIDGRLYPEGASLPGGVKITRVESKRILLVRGKYRQWIDVVSPMGEVGKNDS